MRISDWSSDVCSSDLRRFCRDGSCSAEHRGGIARSNVIMHCSEAGIHLTKSADTLIHNNALIATQGSELLRASTDALIVNNLLAGSLPAREGATYTAPNNGVSRALDRTRVGAGKGVSGGGDVCGRRRVKRKKKK